MKLKLKVDIIKGKSKPVSIKQSKKLNDITRMICSENKIPQEETIELYSSDGYPLQNNYDEITGQGIG